MSVDLILPVSMTMAILAWGLAFSWYAAPRLARLPFADAMQPLLLLHAFRYIGLMFLIPGVTTDALDVRFAVPAAYGDLLTAVLAFAGLIAIRLQRWISLTVVGAFNIVGFVDLINAVVRGIAFTPDGALGAAFWIPALIVPLLLVTHVHIFARLGRELGLGASAIEAPSR
jgi:hypothetical protein